MTAYGRAEYLRDDTRFVAELKSVNNRYRDVIIKLPKTVQALEGDLKPLLNARVSRGRVEVSIQIDREGDAVPYRLEVNAALVDSLIRISTELSDRFGIDGHISMDTLCQMRDVIVAKPEQIDMEKMRTGLCASLAEAIESFEAMRLREGAAMEADFLMRLELLERYAADVAARAPLVVDEHAQRLREAIERIAQTVDVDEARLAQEVAHFAEHSDITEELVRIRSHVAQFRQYLTSEEALGRRLDFLIQELNREVNTIGSKASDTVISTAVVEMKAELEKLREQVQNVE